MSNFPSFHVTGRFVSVWRRHLTVYGKSWKISFIPPLLEPFFYLLAFGIGLSTLVGSIRYRGMTVSYVEFIAPALIAISIMYNTFFETTYSSYVRMYYQKLFNAMIATPLSLEEIITGDIVWGATKSLIATTIMMAVISAFGLIRYPDGLLLLPLAALGGLAFGAVGMFFTGLVPNIDSFNLPIFLFITPMFLFGGTFFPIETLPLWAQQLALILPLTWLVDLARAAARGVYYIELLWECLALVVFTAVLFPAAIIAMHRRLIK